MLSDYLAFVRELPKSFAQIGAMLPSSAAMSKLMVSPMLGLGGPLNILEVGPGTGPFTRQILSYMSDEDNFVICEINPRFMTRLKNTLLEDPNFIRHQERVHFFEGPVQELQKSAFAGTFDIIVSSLPFVNFAPDVVDEIFAEFNSMVRPGGVVTFLQYLGVCRLRELFSSQRTRERVRGVEKVIEKWSERVRSGGNVQKKVSFLNVPPAQSIQFMYH